MLSVEQSTERWVGTAEAGRLANVDPRAVRYWVEAGMVQDLRESRSAEKRRARILCWLPDVLAQAERVGERRMPDGFWDLKKGQGSTDASGGGETHPEASSQAVDPIPEPVTVTPTVTEIFAAPEPEPEVDPVAEAIAETGSALAEGWQADLDLQEARQALRMAEVEISGLHARIDSLTAIIRRDSQRIHRLARVLACWSAETLF